VGIQTLRPGSPVHWGVMLAQGWKGELAGIDGPGSWAVARHWARQAEGLGFSRHLGLRSLPALPGAR
jgi:hypothetical protein